MKVFLYNFFSHDVFAVQSNATEGNGAEADNGDEANKTDSMEYDDDDEIDELEEMMNQLEPKYRRYANWRI